MFMKIIYVIIHKLHLYHLWFVKIMVVYLMDNIVTLLQMNLIHIINASLWV